MKSWVSWDLPLSEKNRITANTPLNVCNHAPLGNTGAFSPWETPAQLFVTKARGKLANAQVCLSGRYVGTF